MPTLFERIADNRRSDSLAAKLRKKRAAFFEHLIETLEKPIRILDVGGTENYWQLTGLSDIDGVKIVLMNMNVLPAKLPNFVSVVGDARKLCYPDQSFDVVFSNSVIEHVGGFLDQAHMAEEIRRVGRGYFIQTPNKYFPLEPHFLFPLFQFLPISLRVWLMVNFDLGWFSKTKDRIKARQIVKSIQLLGRSEFARLFPEASLYEEKFFGLTKSLIVYGGWDKDALPPL